MRLSPKIKNYLKSNIKEFCADSKIYLFGSRVDDMAKGGDIDILILSEKKIERDKIRIFRREFFKTFGVQKIDIVNYTFSEENTFKTIALRNAVLL